jgi:hypothetical protein
MEELPLEPVAFSCSLQEPHRAERTNGVTALIDEVDDDRDQSAGKSEQQQGV